MTSMQFCNCVFTNFESPTRILPIGEVNYGLDRKVKPRTANPVEPPQGDTSYEGAVGKV